jgi:hypothetical protein
LVASAAVLGGVPAGLFTARSPTQSPPSARPPAESVTVCVDRAEFDRHRANLIDELEAVVDELTVLDIAAALPHIRIAASESRAMADALEPRDPIAASHFRRVADALDQATTSLGAFELPDANSWLAQATNEIDQGMASVNQGEIFCRSSQDASDHDKTESAAQTVLEPVAEGDFRIVAPVDGTIVRSGEIEVRGIAPPGREVDWERPFFPDPRTQVNGGGDWSIGVVALARGENDLTFRLVGTSMRRHLLITYEPDV